jgi:hypothetical protein
MRTSPPLRAIGVRDVILWLATIGLLVVCGAGSYEHAAVVPQWTARPPESLVMLHGPYALAPMTWWRSVHPPTLLLGIAALVLLRHQARRRFVAAGVAVYAVALAATLGWYVPELLALTSDPGAAIPAAAWKARADRWEMLSLVRLAALFVASVALLRAVAAPPHRAGEPQP